MFVIAFGLATASRTPVGIATVVILEALLDLVVRSIRLPKLNAMPCTFPRGATAMSLVMLASNAIAVPPTDARLTVLRMSVQAVPFIRVIVRDLVVLVIVLVENSSALNSDVTVKIVASIIEIKHPFRACGYIPIYPLRSCTTTLPHRPHRTP